MSKPVDLSDVRIRVAEYGELAMLVSVGESGTPHVVSVLVTVDGDRLVAQVGQRTAANLRDRPTLSLVWHPPSGGDYLLILDGTAEVGGPLEAQGPNALSITVTSGILHRAAGRTDAGPSCVPVAAADSR